MKKLNKLEINPKKLMKNEELLTMRGGYDCCCQCYNWNFELIGVIGNANALNCNPLCLEYFGHGFGYCNC